MEIDVKTSIFTVFALFMLFFVYSVRGLVGIIILLVIIGIVLWIKAYLAQYQRHKKEAEEQEERNREMSLEDKKRHGKAYLDFLKEENNKEDEKDLNQSFIRSRIQAIEKHSALIDELLAQLKQHPNRYFNQEEIKNLLGIKPNAKEQKELNTVLLSKAIGGVRNIDPRLEQKYDYQNNKWLFRFYNPPITTDIIRFMTANPNRKISKDDLKNSLGIRPGSTKEKELDHTLDVIGIRNISVDNPNINRRMEEIKENSTRYFRYNV